MTLRRRIVMGAATFCLGLALLAVVFEFGLRLYVPQPVGVSWGGWTTPPVHTPDYDFHYRTDEFDIRTRFNSMGLRDRDYSPEKPKDVHRIVVLGDSITEALQVEDREVYTEALEASLNSVESATRYEVINLGMTGFGAADELALWSSLGRRLEPDCVIVQMSLINDLSENLFCRWYRVEDGQIHPVAGSRMSLLASIGQSLGRYSHLVQLTRFAFRSRFGEHARRLQNIAEHKERYHALLYANEGKESDFDDDWKVTFACLGELHHKVTDSGARFLLLIRPLDPDVQGLRETLYPRDILFEFCEEQGIQYLDLTPVFAERSGGDIHQIRFEVDSHWIPQAHAWAAEALWDRIREGG